MKNILIIFGGKSSEYEVSLRSAYSVITNLPKDKYNPILMGITKDGKWLYYNGNIDRIPENKWQGENCAPAAISTDYGEKCINVYVKDYVHKIYIDVVFPVLHGKNGEDGTLQGLLEMSGIPYVGCNTIASAMCMDKAVTNMTADYFGIDQAKWLGITKSDYEKDSETFVNNCIEYLGLPVFIKPANAGSSVGISKAKTKEDIKKAMAIAFKEDYKVIAEENIVGREVECAVLGNDEPIASVIGEIKPANEFYDYEAKYIDGDSVLCIPADLPEETSEKIRETAIKAYKALGCSGLSRVDFFALPDGNIKFNEINTLPGFTSISMYAKLLEAYGIPYGETVDRLINLALER